MNIIAWLEFELAYYDVAVQYISYDAMGTLWPKFTFFFYSEACQYDCIFINFYNNINAFFNILVTRGKIQQLWMI